MGETAQPLPLLRPIVTPTMGGLMDLRAPTSAICTLRWANVVSLLDWFLMIPVDQDQAYSACFPGGGGGFPDWSCDPARFSPQPQISPKKTLQMQSYLEKLNSISTNAIIHAL